MEKYIQNITDEIVQVTKEENRKLLTIENHESNSKLGIFRISDLAFAYECGKQIMQNTNETFEENIPEWCRESVLDKNAGLTDLVFAFMMVKKLL